MFQFFISFICIALVNGDIQLVEDPHDEIDPITLIPSLDSTQAELDINKTCHWEVGEGEVAGVPMLLLVGCISLLTIIGNVLVIMSIAVFRKLRRPSNLFIVSLAVADLMMGGIVMPLGTHYMIMGKWLVGQTACDIWTTIDVLSVTASICTLGAISIDRYIAITSPFQYRKRMSKLNCRIIIVAIWIVSGLIAFVPINFGWWKSDEDCDLRCYEDPTCCQFLPNKTYAIVSSIISFYLPLSITVFAYTVVFKIAVKQRAEIKKTRSLDRESSKCSNRKFILSHREYRFVFTMGMIMGTFVVCWLPFFVANIIKVFCDCCVSETMFQIFNWLGYTNSFFNPIIFCHKKEFREGFKRLLMCGLCKDGYDKTCRARLSEPYYGRKSTEKRSVKSLNNNTLTENHNTLIRTTSQSKSEIKQNGVLKISNNSLASSSTNESLLQGSNCHHALLNKAISNRCEGALS